MTSIHVSRWMKKQIIFSLLDKKNPCFASPFFPFIVPPCGWNDLLSESHMSINCAWNALLHKFKPTRRPLARRHYNYTHHVQINQFDWMVCQFEIIFRDIQKKFAWNSESSVKWSLEVQNLLTAPLFKSFCLHIGKFWVVNSNWECTVLLNEKHTCLKSCKYSPMWNAYNHVCTTLNKLNKHSCYRILSYTITWVNKCSN